MSEPAVAPSFRGQFPVLERYAYLNAGTEGPVPQAAEVVPLDNASHAAALGLADHVHGFDLGKHFAHR